VVGKASARFNTPFFGDYLGKTPGSEPSTKNRATGERHATT
jgi:hypothetical protein